MEFAWVKNVGDALRPVSQSVSTIVRCFQISVFSAWSFFRSSVYSSFCFCWEYLLEIPSDSFFELWLRDFPDSSKAILDSLLIVSFVNFLCIFPFFSKKTWLISQLSFHLTASPMFSVLVTLVVGIRSKCRAYWWCQNLIFHFLANNAVNLFLAPIRTKDGTFHLSFPYASWRAAPSAWSECWSLPYIEPISIMCSDSASSSTFHTTGPKDHVG